MTLGRALIAACLCLIVGLAADAATICKEEWTWHGPIDLGDTAPGFVRLEITPEVFDGSQASLNDLRVLDDADTLAPFVIYLGRTRDIAKTIWRDVRLLNRTFEPGLYARVELDFGGQLEKNRVRVRLSDQNYRRNALVEGSDDGMSWEVVSENGWLFDISLPEHHYQVDTLDFPVNTFRHLRLTVFNMPDDPRTIDIITAESAFHDMVAEKELVDVPTTAPIATTDAKKRQTVYDFDLGFRNLPVAMLDFEVTDDFFHRGYELLGRNSLTETVERNTETGVESKEQETPWQAISSGVLYRVQRESKVFDHTVLMGVNAPYRYLRLSVFDGDDAPLSITEVKASRREASLVLETQPRHNYTLYGGNPKAQRPQFDLAKSIEGVSERDAPAVKLGPITMVERAERLLPWTERHAALIWVVLIATVGVMLALVVNGLRSQHKAQE